MALVHVDKTAQKIVITLQLATPEEFEAYRAYADGDSSPDRTTRQDFERLLPDGLKTRNQHLLSLRAEDSAQVGFLWLTTMERKTGPEAFLLDFVIFPPFRRRGYAREGMDCLEGYVSSLGLETISLSVSQHNFAARTLYEALGYEPVFTRLTKQCKSRTER